VSVTIKKVQGVESVNVSLNKGLATVELKPSNTVLLQKLKDVVKKNGFTPKDAVVKAVGRLTTSAEHKPLFTVAGTGEVFQVESAIELKRLMGKSLLVEGSIPESQAILRLKSADAVTSASK
jgi:copper chaperone CopZ